MKDIENKGGYRKMTTTKKFFAELIGTAVLTLFGCGAAVTANKLVGEVGIAQSGSVLAFTTLLIAIAFGLTIVAMAYSIGNISGCHINPAVSFGMLVSGRMKAGEFIVYVIAQLIGAVIGAAILLAFVGNGAGLGTNGFGTASALGTGAGTAFAVELVLTFVFVLVIMGVTSKTQFASTAGLVIGMSLTLIHILGIPFTGTSVNPARSFGPALIASISGQGSLPMQQLWVFILAPIAGGALAGLVYNALDKKN